MPNGIWGKAKTVAQFTSILVMLVALEFSTWQTGILAGAALPEMVFTLPVLFAQILIWVPMAAGAKNRCGLFPKVDYNGNEAWFSGR